MTYYQPNPACRCSRCSTRGLMGPAVLVTLGILFLLENVSEYPFSRTWPILLIVIGAVQVARYVMPDSGHITPGQVPPPYAGPYPGTPYGQPMTNASQPPVQGAIVTPPPPPVAGALGDGKKDDGDEVPNG